jgi:hypothetical protein
MNYPVSAASSRAAAFSPLELVKLIPVRRAAELNDMHEDSFRKNFPHLVRKISPRKAGVTLRDALELPPPPEAADLKELPAPERSAVEREKETAGI